MVRNEDRSFIEFEEQERIVGAAIYREGAFRFFYRAVTGIFQIPGERTKTSIANRVMENGRVASRAGEPCDN